MKDWLRVAAFLVIGIVVGLFGTQFVHSLGKNQAEPKAQEVQKDSGSKNENKDVAASSNQKDYSSVPAEAQIFVTRGCIQCHSVSGYQIDAGKVGPDLSIAFKDVQEKYGVSLDEFLKAPKTAVMSSVIKGNPLTDEQRNQVVKALQDLSK